ncbi:PIN/TRAM domain-containing protein [Vallitalea okinawensis]|uniref:PIN/TRAM domain-containing protein n=1 Tax=Vallitalea okinawensis TaxID=2078660 RepID=UPI000CFE28BA|nr:PIN domain-containing protein [Vallitalea okinawensis]
MKRFLKLIITFILTIFGVLSYDQYIKGHAFLENFQLIENFNSSSPTLMYVSIFLLLAIISYLLISPFLVKLILNQLNTFEDKFDQMSFQEMVVSTVGIILGLIIANLVCIPLFKFGIVGALVVLLINIVLGYGGYKIAMRKNVEIKLFEECEQSSTAKPKILDTSVIIDGRILDILRTDFIEGKIIIPQFVLAELRHVADSSDSLKRNRGRRGLDILNEIQKQLKVPVEIIEKDYKNIAEVDSKILKLAEEMNATIVTNDFNLNKVADFKGVVVLNINELSNAVKPIVLPGEDMSVTVIKDGKEHEQGIGYLNDGTMIVVEGGRKAIGQTIDVLVTSVLQTAAGRMIFTKMK